MQSTHAEQEISKLQKEALNLISTLDLSKLPDLRRRIENTESGGLYTARVEHLLLSTLDLLTKVDTLAKDPKSLDTVF